MREENGFSKETYQKRMAENLPLLRGKLNLNQQELADIIGTSRQTISLIERGTREMMWDTCMSLTLLFVSNDDTRALMNPLGIDIDAFSEYLNISGSRGPRDRSTKEGDES